MHTEAFTQTLFTQTLLHTDAFTHRHLYTQKLLHTDALTHRHFDTDHTKAFKQTLLHTRFYTDAFYTQKLSHTAHRSFVHKEKNAILPQFLAIDHHFVRKGCNGNLEIAILPQFLTIEPHFVRKGCAGRLANRTFTSVFGDRTSFRAKGLRGTP